MSGSAVADRRLTRVSQFSLVSIDGKGAGPLLSCWKEINVYLRETAII